ncbi:MAG: pepsin/retropepsin-like aspartic protease family protein [Terriglobia bacterium]
MNVDDRLPLRFLTFFGNISLMLVCCFVIQTPLHAMSLDESTVAADADVKDFQLSDLAVRIRKMQPGPERDYFAGLLANRTGHIEGSIRLLKNALPFLRQSQDDRAALALKALADDYGKIFQYGNAAQTYDDLLSHFPSKSGGGTKDDAGVLHLLAGVPPLTITWQGPTQLKTERNPIGSIVTELTVNGVKKPWLLDTGANYSVVTRSFAKELGLKPLPGFGQTGSGLTGLESPLQAAALPPLKIGGATLNNVVVLILDDANLKISFGDQSYQINAILGYPVFQAMGTITFLHDGEFEAGAMAQRSGNGTPMYLRRLTPVIRCRVEGTDLPFTFDTGASGTDLSVRYYDRFKGKGESWKKETYEVGGSSGTVKREMYTQLALHLGVGNKSVVLKNVSITPLKTNSGLDELYGNIGQDFVAGFESFTLDFSKMTFKLGDPLSEQNRK